ncbi:exodeoxyribonuclease VII small subunit [Pasteurella dagmatis]|uniref:Exodeoxyribonuclease 7 small subunit n=1 Tax=Pasteurella dagmatis ATCC 43325 TaxID=667128 RepID=C9PR19_9PAST|nr:exodeoxyribonuclease VII small subunit [Pasteurella dagmatis]EEX49920.1 exodeoxyribonuclease VII, small subunit [Pasteurella dagmatis ATCC 43325]SNV60519.1 exodeoxyribonuclease VII small subunit [Pasteurella dagmatis]
MAKKPTEKAELDFETTLKQLEGIVTRLESGSLPLEEALKEFENGIVLANLGQERLQQAEQRIQILLKKNATTELSDYQIEE